MLIRTICTFLFFAAIINCKGQNISFNHLTLEKGLPSNTVLSITKDARGFMWFGSATGLARYDGVRFREYKSDSKDAKTISSDYIITLFPDSKKNLWVGTFSGLNLYNPGTDNFQKIPLGESREVSIYCINEDGAGRLWVGTSNGLYILSGKDKKVIKSFFASDYQNSIPGNIIRAVISDKKGNIWAGTNNGLSKLNESNGVFQIINFRKELSKNGSLNADYITALATDKNDNLWIGTQHDGVNLYTSSGDGYFISISHNSHINTSLVNNNIRKIISTKEGNIWIGTQEGISIINPDTKVIHSLQHESANNKSLSQNSVYSLFEDSNGSIWVGTYFGGVNLTHSIETPFAVIQNNVNYPRLSNNVVSCIAEDENKNLWIGTEGGGLNYWDRNKNTFTVYKNKLNDPASLGSNLVKTVFFDIDGNPWIGTHGGGLNVFDRKTNQFIRYLFRENDPASLLLESSSISEDTKGRLWVATNSGIKVFKRNELHLEEIDISDISESLLKYRPNVVFRDNRNQIWIGSGNGLYKLQNDEIITIDTTKAVNCITQDSRGTLWMDAGIGKLAKLEPGSSKLYYFDLPETKTVLGVIEDKDGILWISTNNGLLKNDVALNKIQIYTTSDGIAGNQFNINAFLKDNLGEFFFGGYSGITHFYPSDIQINSNNAPVVFTGLKLFNKHIGVNDESRLLQEDITQTRKVVFKHFQDVFTLEFALLSYVKSDKNRYAYQLEGYDKEWNETHIPAVTYTNLPAGSYTLWIKGANNDGVWSEPVSIKIIVKPPFWLTWWAYVIYAIALGAILFLIVRFIFLRTLIKKEDELHQIKLNFFTNVSHEIRTHLTLIMAPVEKMLESKEKDSFIQQQLGGVKNNADRLLKLVSELMDFRKAETNNLSLHIQRENIVPFLQEIYNSFRDLSLMKNITMSFLHNKEDMPLYFDREQLEKVFFNLLANAFKFTPDGGRVVLMAEQKNNKIIVTVTDNGRGIAPEYLDKLFTNFFQVADHGLQNTGYGIGLALSRLIVELHNGKIEVESKPSTAESEGETVFTVTLLQGNIHFDTVQPADKSLVSQSIVAEFPPDAAEHIPITDETGTTQKSMTLLIAEDNPELRLLVKETFSNRFNIIDCENGLIGWNRAIEQIPDIVISDVMMPEMDGFTLCEKLKTDERTSHIPVILLTAKSSQNDQVAGLETGADIYITKPFSTKILDLNVRNLLVSREKLRNKISCELISSSTSGKSSSALETDNFVNSVDKEFLQKIILLIEEHMDNPEFGVEMLSRKVAMSVPILYKKVKAVSGLSVNEFVKSLRMKKAAELLAQKKMTIYEVAYAVGYNDRKYFSQEFKKHFGKTPSDFV